MPTKKPLSTISYNSEPFLVAKLSELQKAGVIDVWAYIGHDPEPDESHDESLPKAHFHVYAEPGRSVDPTELRNLFKEADPARPDTPRGTMKWRNSVFPDWFLYGIHDPDYLAAKGQARVHHYSEDQFVYSDEADWHYLVSTVDRLALKSTTETMKQYILSGKSFSDMVSDGLVPVNLCPQYKLTYETLQNGPRFTRGTREGHDQVVDTLTGELREKALPEAKFVLDKKDPRSLDGHFVPLSTDDELPY